MNKTCGKCKKIKETSEFYKDSSKKDGHSSICKLCRKKYGHRYSQVKRKEIRENKREYRSNNKEKIAENARRYRLENSEKLSKQRRLFRESNKDRLSKIKKMQGIRPACYEIYARQLSIAENVDKDLNGFLLVSCTYCGKMYIPATTSVKNRVSALLGRMEGECRLYCSEACKQACPSYKRQVYWKSQRTATSREVSAQFRQLVLKRDNWICQKCGARVEAELHVHHIEGATQQPGMANDLENGITLCKECHKYVHSQDGCKYHELRCS
jgi:5-methylcytosine-specific restriction endonuclease McrA